MTDPRIEMLRAEWGMVGYGVYFALLEMVSEAIDEVKPFEEWGYLPEICRVKYLATRFQVEAAKLDKILNDMASLELISPTAWAQGRIYVPKILKRLDAYFRRVAAGKKGKTERLRTNSVPSTDIDQITVQYSTKDKKRALELERRTKELMDTIPDMEV
jgi:hypothetical protein